MNRIIQGVVHGNVIELKEPPGVAEGQEVEVILRIRKAARVWGDGIRNSAGALASDPPEEDDRILEEIYQDRKRDTRREIPE